MGQEKGIWRMKISSQEEMEALGAKIAACLRPGDCVFLMGDLGVGKSVLARSIGQALGVQEPMPSPSFGLLLPHAGCVQVNHFDLYRLEDYSEFVAAGLEEALLDEKAVSLVEWPEILAGEAPSTRLEVRIAYAGAPDAREVSIRCLGMEGRDCANFGD